jgi:hypothetical protein
MFAMPDPPRRFPTPWRAATIPGGYCVLTPDEARRIAVNIADARVRKC